MTDNIKLAIACALAASLFAGGWLARTWYDDSVEFQIERVKNEVSVITAGAIAAVKVENKTIYAKTIERIKTEQVYAECKADHDTMLLTNEVLKWK